MTEAVKPKHTPLGSKRQDVKRNRKTIESPVEDVKGKEAARSERKAVTAKPKHRYHVKTGIKASPSEPSCVTPVGNSILPEDVLNCPVCIESFDEMELRFYPCPCGYRVCTMCVHLIKEKADGKCPHCRQGYSSDRAQLLTEIDADVRRIFEKETTRLLQESMKKPVKVIPLKPRRILPIPPDPPARPQPPSLPPSPQIKLTRFSGGMSVWD